MPSFEQIEVLQNQCYIHKKIGWIISDFSFVKLDDECLIKVSFSKIDNKTKSLYILPNGSILNNQDF